jgi:hypothetical protein
MRVLILIGALSLSACTQADLNALFPPVETVEVEPVVLVPPPPPPPADARTADEFDTTSAEERAAALATPALTGEQRLGTTLASLGSPADPGIWIQTPLVSEVTLGRVEVTATGKTVSLELRPSGGEPGSGSQISLPAMRLLEVPLTAIQELTVYAGGAS